MKIGLIGMGYVGTINAVCLAEAGHEVMCWDINDAKMRLLREGICPFPIPLTHFRFARQVQSGGIRVAVNLSETVMPSDVTYVCVGTPKDPDGSANLDGVESVTSMIGEILKHKQSWHHSIVYRSTIPPGNYDSLLLRMLVATGQRPDSTIEEVSAERIPIQSFRLIAYPEFIRQEQGIEDFLSPTLTIIGCAGPKISDFPNSPILKIIASLGIKNVRFTDFDTAMMVKYAVNAMNACKIVFANSIAEASDALDIDGSKVMDWVEQFSSLSRKSYLKPGLPFGGPCLEKDLQALVAEIRPAGIRTSFLLEIFRHNGFYDFRLSEAIFKTGVKTVGFHGMGFKQGSVDLSNSPSLAILRQCEVHGLSVLVIDHGIPFDILESRFPNSLAMENFDAFVAGSDLIVTNNLDANYSGFTPIRSYPNLHLKDTSHTKGG